MRGWPAPVVAAVRAHAGAVGVAALCGLAVSVAEIGLSLEARRIVDQVVPGRPGAGLLVAASTLVALALGRAAARFGRRASAEGAGHAVARDVRVALFDRLLRTPLEVIESREVGRLLVRLVSDLSGIRRIVSRGLADLLADGLAALALVTGLVLLDWRLGLGVAAIGAAEVAAVRSANGPMRRASARVRSARARLAGVMEDDLSAIAAVKAFRREGKETGRVRRRSARLYRHAVQSARLGARSEAVADAAHGLALAGTLALGAWRVGTADLTLGTLVAALLLAHHLFPSARRLVLANEALQTGRVQAARVGALLEAPVEPHPRDVEPGEAPAGLLVTAEGLDGHLDLAVRRGEIVALLGPAGSGKSALAAYLLGLRRPVSGRLAIDGRDVTALAPATLRRLVAWSATDAPLVRGSLSKNVRFGRPGAGEGAVRRALAASGLDRLVARVDGGLGYRLGPRGRGLSAGERAQVALARALLLGRPILVLDEPFAGLAAAEAEAVWEALRARRAATATILLTSHPQVAAAADRIARLPAPTAAAPSAITNGRSRCREG